MLIFIPGALPPDSYARELAKHLAKRAPTLYAWMRRTPAQVETLDLQETGCTAVEAWSLRRAGFQPQPGQRLSAGLGPLRANSTSVADNEPVWLADLSHVALGANHVALAAPGLVAVDDDEDRQLFDAVTPWLDGTGIRLSRLSPGRWRVGLPAGLTPDSASPAVVSGGQLDSWWPQDEASRPWRRLVNEVQMIWHDHPVNQARTERGLLPINSLWLYGGGLPWTATPAEPTDIQDNLASHAAAGDWAAWLEALAALDRDVLAPMAQRGEQPSIVLAGEDRLVTLAPPRTLLPRWFPRREQNWKSWWQPPV